MDIVETRTFTTFEAAKICKVSHSTIVNWANRGELRITRTPGRHRRITPEDLVDFMKRYHIPVPANLLQRPRRIMVVDDDPAVTTMVQRALEGLPLTKTEACHKGIHAIALIGREAPDLLILDVRMPGVDGCEVLRYLAQSPELEELYVVAMTGEMLTPAEEALIAECADLFVRKPFSPRELRAAVVSALELDPAAAGAAG